MTRSLAARRYLLIRGPQQTQRRLIQATYTALKRRQHPDLAPLMEYPLKTQASLLFYPGCSIYSPTTTRNTLRILDHLDIPYQTLGGLTYCCGLPHRLQGQTKKADACTTRLTTAINTVNPQTIITSCLECLEALQHIKTQTNAPYEILHTLELIHQHQAKFPHTHTDTPLLLHEPCRLTPRLRTTIIDLAASLGQHPILLPPPPKAAANDGPTTPAPSPPTTTPTSPPQPPTTPPSSAPASPASKPSKKHTPQPPSPTSSTSMPQAFPPRRPHHE